MCCCISDVDDTGAVVEFDEPNRDLFILAVLLNRPEMARLFWEEGKVWMCILTQHLSTENCP